jgi:hypothetical protein
MPDTTCHMSISLDGFVAGPDQSRENPLGKRFHLDLHALRRCASPASPGRID